MRLDKLVNLAQLCVIMRVNLFEKELNLENLCSKMSLER